MNKRLLGTFAILFVGISIVILIYPLKRESKKPNILFILSDDHSSIAISAYGSELNKTPNIDRIASEGILFKNAFVVSSLCAPSRASILTGQYGGKTGFLRIGDVLDTSLITLPKLLQQENYQTAILGKWHLKSQPLGFDYCQVVRGQGSFFNPEFFTGEDWDNKGKKGKVEQGYFSDIITDKAITWLNNRKQDKPFALFVHHKAPHSPHITPEKYDSLFNRTFPFPSSFNDDFSNKSSFLKDSVCPFSKLQYAYDFDIYNSVENKHAPSEIKRGTKEYKEWAYNTLLKGYFRQIENLDENVGRLLDYLEDYGLSKRTIVIYTSDNGWFIGQHGLFNKQWMYEESLKIPLFVKYPGKVRSKKTESRIISALDFAPTLLDYAGINKPEFMQGASLRPILEDKEVKDWRSSFFYHYYDQFGVPEHYGIRTERYKLIRFPCDSLVEYELYDLKNDPEELNNVFGEKKFEDTQKLLMGQLAQEKLKFENQEN